MKQFAFLLLSTICFCSCSKKENLQSDNKTQDTIVAKKISKNEFNPKITSYQLVIKGDTSKTSIVFRQSDEGKLSLALGLGQSSRKGNYKEMKPYRLRYLEVKKLIQEAAKDLDTKSLEDVGIGWLMETGDLAIDVSREYFKRHSNPGRIGWNQIGPKQREQINNVLLTSRTGKDLNNLLAPFGKKIDRVTRTEKLMFEPKKALDYYTIYETDTLQIPEFIMDAGIDFSVVDK